MRGLRATPSYRYLNRTPTPPGTTRSAPTASAVRRFFDDRLRGAAYEVESGVGIDGHPVVYHAREIGQPPAGRRTARTHTPEEFTPPVMSHSFSGRAQIEWLPSPVTPAQFPSVAGTPSHPDGDRMGHLVAAASTGCAGSTH